MQGEYASHYTTAFAWPVTYNLLYVWCVSENQGKKTCYRESNPHLSFSCRAPYRFGYHNSTQARKKNQVKTLYGSGNGGARSSREKAAFGKKKKLNPNFHEPFQTVAPNQLYIQLVQNQCKILVKSKLKKREKINKLKNK